MHNKAKKEKEYTFSPYQNLNYQKSTLDHMVEAVIHDFLWHIFEQGSLLIKII